MLGITIKLFCAIMGIICMIVSLLASLSKEYNSAILILVWAVIFELHFYHIDED